MRKSQVITQAKKDQNFLILDLVLLGQAILVKKKVITIIE